jgi:hypothetical protein
MTNEYTPTLYTDSGVSHSHDDLSDPAKVFLSKQGYVGCAIQFDNYDKEYHYFYNPSKFNLVVGSQVIVPARGEYKPVTVTKVNLPFGQVFNKATKLVAAVVDTSWHEKAMAYIALASYQHEADRFEREHAEAAKQYAGLVTQPNSPFEIKQKE